MLRMLAVLVFLNVFGMAAQCGRLLHRMLVRTSAQTYKALVLTRNNGSMGLLGRLKSGGSGRKMC